MTKYFFLMPLIFYSSLCKCQFVDINELFKKEALENHFKGNIKTVSYYENLSNDVNKEDNVLIKKVVYNQNKEIVIDSFFKIQDGTFEAKNTYQYNTNHQVVSSYSYKDNKIIGKTLFKYDKKNRYTLIKEINPLSPIYTYEFIYDTNQNNFSKKVYLNKIFQYVSIGKSVKLKKVQEINVYDSKKKLLNTTIYKQYNKNNDSIVEEVYIMYDIDKPDTNLILIKHYKNLILNYIKKVMAYSLQEEFYNTTGDIEKIVYKNNRPENAIIDNREYNYQYEYDSQHNWVKKYENNATSKKNILKEKRIFEYY